MRRSARRWGSLVVVAAIGVGVAIGYLPHSRANISAGRGVPVGELLEEREETGPCQAGRWPVKVLKDSAAAQIKRTAMASTVTALGRLPAPDVSDDTPRLSMEKQVVTVHANLYADHHEPDLDYHLVLHDPANDAASMIVEFPDASCAKAAGQTDRAAMSVARRTYELACGPAGDDPGTYYVRGQADVTGVRFFDTIEQQFGRAPNAVELHPVTKFAIVGPCTKFGGPSHFSVGSSIADGTSLTAPTPWVASPSLSGSTLQSVDFVVDGAEYQHTAVTPAQVTLSPASLAAGSHYLTVSAAWRDGSVARTTTRVTVSAGTPLRPSLRSLPSSARRGGTVRVTGTQFFANEPADLSLVPRGRRSVLALPVLAGTAGGITLSMTIPAGAVRGNYVVRACQRSCQVRAIAALTVK